MAHLIKATRTVACIGRNYALHAKELGSDAPSAPFAFLKAPSTLLDAHRRGATIELPPDSKLVHHEVELAVVIGRRAHHVRWWTACGVYD